MTSDRPYRKALSFEAVRQEVRRCSGSQFDPRVAEAFLSIEPDTWKEIHDLVNCRTNSRARAAFYVPRKTRTAQPGGDESHGGPYG